MNLTASHRGTGLPGVCVLIGLLAGLPGQDKTGAGAEKAAAPSATPTQSESKSPTPTPSPSPPTLATITEPGCKVRCFPSNLSPSYETELPKGAVVQVGELVGEFRRVVMPLGVVGYVSKRFTTAPEKGLVKTNRKRVSFRYRPTPKDRAEAPVQLLPEATALHYVGEAGDWWKVRLETDSAYLPIKAIEVATESTEAMRKSFAQLVSAQEAEWRSATSAYEQGIAEAAARQRRTERLDELRAAFNKESDKDLKDQKLAPIRADLVKLIDSLPTGSANLEPAKFLLRAIDQQQVFVDADIVLHTKEPAPPKPRVAITPTPVDELNSRLDTIGWLTHVPNAGGPSSFRLQKGGRVIAFLYCNSLRYDLALFDGVEIGVRGVRKQDAAVPYLDVQRIEVLGQVR